MSAKIKMLPGGSFYCSGAGYVTAEQANRLAVMKAVWTGLRRKLMVLSPEEALVVLDSLRLEMEMDQKEAHHD